MASEAQILLNRRNAPKIELCSNLSLSKGLPCVAFCEAGSSTSVENPLQISSFMQNKANLPDDQMNVTTFLTKDYENKIAFGLRKNKPNTKPNKANPPAPNLADLAGRQVT